MILGVANNFSVHSSGPALGFSEPELLTSFRHAGPFVVGAAYNLLLQPKQYKLFYLIQRLALGLGAACNFFTSPNQAGLLGLAEQCCFYHLNFTWPAAWAWLGQQIQLITNSGRPFWLGTANRFITSFIETDWPRCSDLAS